MPNPGSGVGEEEEKNKTHCALEGFTVLPGSQIPDKSTVCGGGGRWVPRVEWGVGWWVQCWVSGDRYC